MRKRRAIVTLRTEISPRGTDPITTRTRFEYETIDVVASRVHTTPQGVTLLQPRRRGQSLEATLYPWHRVDKIEFRQPA